MFFRSLESFKTVIKNNNIINEMNTCRHIQGFRFRNEILEKNMFAIGREKSTYIKKKCM